MGAIFVHLGDRVRFNPADGVHGKIPPGHEFYVTAKSINADGLTVLYGSEHGAILALDCEPVSSMKCDR